MKLPLVLIGARQQAQVVRMVPIERRRNIFLPIVSILDRFGFQKKLNGFLGAPHAAQFVSVHMLGMRNLRRHFCVDAGVFQRF